MLNDLLQGALFLLPIGAGVALLVILGRDRDDADFTVADYREPEPDRQQLIREALVSLRDRSPMVLGPGATFAPLILPPVPADSSVTPPLCRQLLIDRAVPTLSDAAIRATADDWLRELGEHARAQPAAAR